MAGAEVLTHLEPPAGLRPAHRGVRTPAVLAAIAGRFVLSLNDCREVRQIFAAFAIEAVGTHYGVAGQGAKPAREVIITNA